MGTLIIPPAPFEKGGFRQQWPVRKLHVAVLPPSPQPSPPEAGGEGVSEAAKSNNHKRLLQNSLLTTIVILSAAKNLVFSSG